MVGHSLGGLTVRVFVHDYSSEVAGVVLIDSMTPQQFAQSPTNNSLNWILNPGHFPLAVLGRLGIVRLLAKPPGIAPSLPPNAEAYYALCVRPQNIQALITNLKGMPASGVQASAVKSFGDLPLIVLTGQSETDLPGWQRGRPSCSNCHPIANSCLQKTAVTILNLMSQTLQSKQSSKWLSRSVRQRRTRF